MVVGYGCLSPWVGWVMGPGIRPMAGRIWALWQAGYGPYDMGHQWPGASGGVGYGPWVGWVTSQWRGFPPNLIAS